MKVMAIDYGDVRIGLAISDMLGKMAFPYETYKSVSNKEDVAHIVDVILSEEVSRVVLGNPVNMNGTLGPRHELTVKFKERLEKKLRYTDKLDRNVEVILWDERLSSVSADRALIGLDVSREGRKQVIDKVAASIFLQSYLDYMNRGRIV